MKRVWFLKDGQHLCEKGLVGTGTDEYGHKTYWLRLVKGILVFQGRRWHFQELVEQCETFEEAKDAWAEYHINREADGIK